MRITYIFQSCFVIECEKFSILLDYCKDSGKSPNSGYVHDTLLKKPGPLYIISSHSHRDHFNEEVLQWRQNKKDIIYLLSDDIRQRERLTIYEDNMYFFKKGDSYLDPYIDLQAFGSTDIGVSMYFKIEGKHVFHAGDLNNWHWKDESTASEVRKADRRYNNEIKELHQFIDHLNLVFFPVDPRLGTDFDLGARQFIDLIKTDVFIPMHFWERPQETTVFGTYAESKGCHFVLLAHPGEQTTV